MKAIACSEETIDELSDLKPRRMGCVYDKANKREYCAILLNLDRKAIYIENLQIVIYKLLTHVFIVMLIGVLSSYSWGEGV